MKYLYFAAPPVALVLLGLAILWVADLPIAENLVRLLKMFIGGIVVGCIIYIDANIKRKWPEDDRDNNAN